VLFNEQAVWSVGGAVIIAIFLTLNLILGRTTPQATRTAGFRITIALVDATLIIASLYVANQLTTPIVMLCLGVLILSIAGLRLATIAVSTLAMMGIYLFVVWSIGEETFLRSSVLLRVPLLFTTAIAFAWLVEAGAQSSEHAGNLSTPRGQLDACLDEQLETIQRCEEALRDGSSASMSDALRHLAQLNRNIRNQVTTILGH
jgi:hypothetical protein